MKKIILLAMFLCAISYSAESALPRLDKAASSAKVSSSETSASNSTVVDKDSSEINNSTSSSNTTENQNTETGLAKLPNGKAYIGVSTFLSVRDEPFGAVLAQLHNNDEVLIVNRKGDWYEIESEKGSGWIYGKCVFDSPNKNTTATASDTAIIKTTSDTNSSNTYNYYTFKNPGEYSLQMDSSKNTDSQKTKTTNKTTTKKTTSKKTTDTKKTTKSSGSLQSKIVQTAKDIVKKYSKKGSFPYAPGLKGGVLGCAQVATTVLKKAGAI
ncbi:MAG: hypothetical protein J6Z11_16055, partial [Candidatus Riflebacteria bacterium]|nr:hypothetical protein [Candidatus Riflebacteria bacterium]